MEAEKVSSFENSSLIPLTVHNNAHVLPTLHADYDLAIAPDRSAPRCFYGNSTTTAYTLRRFEDDFLVPAINVCETRERARAHTYTSVPIPTAVSGNPTFPCLTLNNVYTANSNSALSFDNNYRDKHPFHTSEQRTPGAEQYPSKKQKSAERRSKKDVTEERTTLKWEQHYCPVCNMGKASHCFKNYKYPACFWNHIIESHCNIFSVSDTSTKFICCFCPCSSFDATCGGYYNSLNQLLGHLWTNHSQGVEQRQWQHHRCLSKE